MKKIETAGKEKKVKKATKKPKEIQTRLLSFDFKKEIIEK